MTDLHTLATRCLTAQADETREVEAEIWCALHGKKLKRFWPEWRDERRTKLSYTEPPKRTEITGDHAIVEPFLTSLDAAMSLARDGREVEQVLYSALMKMQFLEVPYDNFRRDIPRYVTAAALLARAAG